MDERPRPSIEEEGQAIVEGLGGRWTPIGGMCRCPAHDDRTPSLSVRPGRTRLLLHCFAGCAPADVLRALRSARLMDASSIPGVKRWGHPAPGLREAALRIWQDAGPLAGTPAEAYLASRGLATGSPELRYHARTPCGPRPLTEHRPALIAAVRDEQGIAGIHRTFIDVQGNGLASDRAPRCGLGRFGTGAVRLGGTAVRLGLAEGVETALSAAALFQIPCWATLGAVRFACVALPAHIEELFLFLDHDSGGRRAERLALHAFAHVPYVHAYYPEGRGDDWNDVLLQQRARPKQSGRAGI